MYKLIHTELVKALNYEEEREDTKKVLSDSLGVELRIDLCEK